MLDETKYLVLGKIKSPVGLKGEVRLQLKANAAESLKNLKQFHVGEEILEPEYIRTGLREDTLTVKFRGVEDRESAFLLAGKVCYTSWDEAPALKEGEFYIHDVIGLSCVDEDGNFVGSVTGVLMGKQQLYEIAKGKTSADVEEIRKASKEQARKNELHMEEFRRNFEKSGSPNLAKAMKDERKKLEKGPSYETFLVPIVGEFVVRTDLGEKTIYLKNIQGLMTL